MDLKWTDKVPTVSGYYWTVNLEYMDFKIEEIEIQNGIAKFYVFGEDVYYEFEGKWLFAGPIPMPPFPIIED